MASGLTQEQRDAIRASLGVDAQPSGPDEAVAEWVGELELAPGSCPAGTTTDLYWVFADWYSRRYPGQPPFDHWMFTLHLRGLGLGNKKRLAGKYWFHMTNRASADKLNSLRDALGPRPNLDWRLGALPAAYKGYKRSGEFKDDEYRKRKRREAIRRRNKRVGASIEARQVAARHLLRVGGR